MKFQRNARILRNQIDIAPFAGMFFCLVIFMLLTSLVYTPGVQITLPTSDSAVSGVEGPFVAVAMGQQGQLYYEGELISEKNFAQRLGEAVKLQSQPLTLVVRADKDCTLQQLKHLGDLAYSAGIKHLSQQVLPRTFDSPGERSKP